MDLPPETARTIADAARSLQIARGILEKARTWDEQQIAQREFDRAQEAMIQASMIVNRGLQREEQSA